ncbi:MAG TPA: NUDIX domain-containing protein [Candidatus Nanoarchaeia archaeon]|nr:NUDIX domain-containing protein [Candidatus Nanoarchaeia archaeon]
MNRMNEEKSVGGILFRKIGNITKFLILKRTDNGIWDFPKGHTESNEEELATLNREMKEELGLTQFKMIPGFKETIFYVSSHSGNKRTWHLYLIYTDEEPTLSSEHTEMKWISLDDVKDYFKYDDIERILKRALEAIDEKNISHHTRSERK